MRDQGDGRVGERPAGHTRRSGLGHHAPGNDAEGAGAAGLAIGFEADLERLGGTEKQDDHQRRRTYQAWPAPGGRVRQRSWDHNHCSGICRIAASTLSVHRAVSSTVARSRSFDGGAGRAGSTTTR